MFLPRETLYEIKQIIYTNNLLFVTRTKITNNISLRSTKTFPEKL